MVIRSEASNGPSPPDHSTSASGGNGSSRRRPVVSCVDSPSASPHGSSSPELLRPPHLARLSANAKYAVPVNQIDHVEIRSCYEREGDDVTIYVMDVYVHCVQSGIPFKTSITTATHHSSGDENDPETLPAGERALPAGPAAPDRKPQDPHYRLEYRYSDFRKLRLDLQQAVNLHSDPLHVKWCRYCTRVENIVQFARFPSRCIIEKGCRRIPWLRRLQTRIRRRTLAYFLNRLLRGAKDDARYRSGEEQCEGFVRTSFLLKEFLAEPHMRSSCTGW